MDIARRWHGAPLRRICFYHAGCPDGFGAAWAVRQCWGERGEYRPFGHREAPPAEIYAGARLVFVDITPATEVLLALSAHCAELLVLDHHVSAQKRWDRARELHPQLAARRHRVLFDLDHSGAVLAWRHFHPDRATPPLLRYIEDCDLWRFALPDSDEINAAINSYPQQFEIWDRLVAEPRQTLVTQGVPLVRAERTAVARALGTAHAARLAGLVFEAINSTCHQSRIGHELARRRAYGHPAGVVYRLQEARVDVSIYSIGDLDVSLIAERYGGGGHRNAAGFQVDLADWVDRLSPRDTGADWRERAVSAGAEGAR